MLGACRVPCFCSQPPAFALGSSKVAAGVLGEFSFFFLVFVSFVQNLPLLCMNAVIFSPIQFLVFCCSRRGETRCTHCSRGSQVPAFLTLMGGREGGTKIAVRERDLMTEPSVWSVARKGLRPKEISSLSKLEKARRILPKASRREDLADVLILAP